MVQIVLPEVPGSSVDDDVILVQTTLGVLGSLLVMSFSACIPPEGPG